MAKSQRPQANPTTLDAELRRIIKVVEKQDRHEQAAKKLESSSRALKWRAVAQAYLWWREASQQSAYLDTLYQQSDIPNNQLGNRTNFNPLVRLIWGIHGERWAHVSSLAKTIAALDDEYTANPHLYKRNAEDELVAYIEDNGGLSGVRQKSSLKFDDENAVVPDEKPKKANKKKTKELPKETSKELLKRQTDHIDSSKGTASINIGDVAVNTANTTGADLIVVLAKRDSVTGNLIVLGTTNDTTLVEQAVLHCVDFDQTKLTPILRLIVECLRPHVVPRALHKRIVRDKFFTKHKVVIDDDGKKEERREAVRFVFTKGGDVLLSKTLSDASLLTISQPKTIKLALPNAIFMRGMDRYWLETDLINDGQIALYMSEPSDALADVTTKHVKATKQVALKNELTGTERAVYFYDFDLLDDQLQHQPTIKKPDQIGFDWKLEASKTFIDRLCAKHFDEWLDYVGDRIHLSHNKAFQLVFADDHIEVRSHYKPEETNGYARIGSRFSSRYGSDAQIKRNVAACAITVSPLDIIELFAALRSFKLQGKVLIEGNSRVLRVTYETEAARHLAYVPSCNEQGKRSSEHFTRYVADA